MSPQMICTNCYLKGTPKNYTRGNAYIKVVTWPLSTFARYKGCPGCGAENMVPIDSPRGQELARIAATFEQPTSPGAPALDPIETSTQPGSPRFRTRDEYEAWKKSQTGERGKPE